MRVAVISMLERASGEPFGLRGGLALAGRSLGERQVEFALELECERILCLTEGIGPDVIAIQHAAEQGGAKFVTLRNPKSILGQVVAADEMLVFADGLLPASDAARELVASGGGVMTLPADIACPAGFERIDLTTAWAGAMLVPGRLAEQLSDLPDDVDLSSALLRIALQARVEPRALPLAELDEERWLIVSDARQLDRLEPGWLRRHSPAPDVARPGQALASVVARAFGRALLNRPALEQVPLIAAIVVLLTGIVCAVLGYTALGLGLAATAFVTTEFGEAIGSMRREGRSGLGPAGRLGRALSLGFDAALTAILALGASGSILDRVFLGALPVLAIRLVPRLLEGRWSGLPADRAAFCVIMSIASAFGLLQPALQLFLLVLLGFCTFSALGKRG